MSSINKFSGFKSLEKKTSEENQDGFNTVNQYKSLSKLRISIKITQCLFRRADYSADCSVYPPWTAEQTNGARKLHYVGHIIQHPDTSENLILEGSIQGKQSRGCHQYLEWINGSRARSSCLERDYWREAVNAGNNMG